ncbi:MAG: WYL domain-containing protein [Vallitaleaceae bacterium]|jgi:predicted DNA-binding transcriptional regulator YafY|nr:WYL domain-containing protein [Vallitaleaceae bacterium]
MRVHRLIAILVMIEQKGTVKAKELSQTLEVSSRTIYRDIDVLCEAGFPLYATTGPKGGIHFTDSYSLGIDKQDKTLLLFELLHQLPILSSQENMQISLNQGLQSLQDLLPDASNQSPLSDKIIIDEDTWWNEQSSKVHIKPIIDSLWYLKSLHIHYKKKGQPASQRLVNPYGLILKHTTWYLVAYCHQSQSVRTFHCSRITKSNLTNNGYKIPTTFNLSTHWHTAVNGFINEKITTEYYPVTIEIPFRYSYILDKYDVEHLIKNENSYNVAINLSKEDFAKEDLLMLIGFCKILSPKAMVDFAKSSLEKQRSIY